MSTDRRTSQLSTISQPPLGWRPPPEASLPHAHKGGIMAAMAYDTVPVRAEGFAEGLSAEGLSAEGFTVEDLTEMPDDGRRYELVDGVLVVSPAPRPRHQLAAFRLGEILTRASPPDLVVIPAPIDVP